MEPLAILQTDTLDLLFENRNKTYGAYMLRKYYNRRLLTAMGVTMTTVVLISFFLYRSFQISPLTVKPYIIPDTFLGGIPANPPATPVHPPKPPAAARHIAQVEYVTPVITREENPKPLATIDQLNNTAIGAQTIAGPPDNGLEASEGHGLSGTAAIPSETGENSNAVQQWAEVMPEFPGGIEALKRFLLKNLRMPGNGLEEGTQVRVVARFVVGSDGKVRDIEIVQSADMAFNTEVKRVISKMPDWKPGVQNHRNVAVYFSLPVNFVSAE